MKEIPILFRTPMVRAILEGRKTQTRRIVKPSIGTQKNWLDADLINMVPHGEKTEGGWQMHHPRAGTTFNGVRVAYDSPLGWVRCPYGRPGDILWVRETWHPKRHNFPIGFPYEYKATAEEDGNPTDEPWKPSIFMPKEACRIILEVTDVRVERLQDISEEDAVAEGIALPNYAEQAIKDVHYPDPSEIYAMLWESINGEGSWAKNPWVWVIEFKRIS